LFWLLVLASCFGLLISPSCTRHLGYGRAMKVSSHFDGGNIEIVDITRPGDAHLQIRHDSHSEFLQWFNFRVSEARGLPLVLHIDNAGQTSYPPGWKGYRAVATYDRQHFFRVPTDYDGKRLTIRHTPARDSVYYSYFAPYSHERHQDLIARSLAADGVRHELLGHTLDGRDMDLLTIDPSAGPAATPPPPPTMGAAPAGSSPVSTPARPWPNGSSRACSPACSTPRTPSPASCGAAPSSTSSPT
jgi:hypothetical protein